MLLPFQRRFAPLVWEGSKTHSIRLPRKNPPTIGETVYCYTDSRQKSMTKLGDFDLASVDELVIYITDRRLGYMPIRPGSRRRFAIDWGRAPKLGLELAGVKLTPDELDAFAWSDGFRCGGSTQAAPGPAWAEMSKFLHIEALKNKARRFPCHAVKFNWEYSRAGRHNSRLVNQLVDRYRLLQPGRYPAEDFFKALPCDQQRSAGRRKRESGE